MKRLLSSTVRPVINLTPAAWNKIRSVLQETGGKCFLFGATGGGCNGFNYEFRYINKEEYNSIYKNNKIKPLVIENNEAAVIVDPLSEFLIMGTTIDYYKDIYENKFIYIREKQQVTSCGCGTSFNLK